MVHKLVVILLSLRLENCHTVEMAILTEEGKHAVRVVTNSRT